MKRREFLQASSLAAIASGGARALLADDPKPTSAATASGEFGLLSPPVLQNPTPDSITVVWAVNGLSTGWVEYGETEALGLRADDNSQGLLPLDERVFKVRLAGLRPGGKYFYRVCAAPIAFNSAYDIQRGATTASRVYCFTALDPAAATTSFSVINDTHETTGTLDRLGAMLKANPTESLIWNGDMFNDIRSEQQIIKQVLAPAGQEYAATAPLLPVRGNHDVRGVAARLLDRYFDLPSGLWFYTLRQGPVAFLVLDTGEDKPDKTPVYAGLNDFDRYRSAQQHWLKQVIQRPEFRSAPFRVAIAHIPLVWHDYSQIGLFCPDGKAKWHDLLVEAKINLIISGHTHKHTWFPAGEKAPYAQLIGGGPKLEIATLIQGRADANEMRITVQNLDGQEIDAYKFQSPA